jgi:hypothetical protein
MLQPRKPLDLSGANEILSADRPALDLSSAESILKKKDSTVSKIKSGSEMNTGSSAGKGFPEIDTNSVAPGMGVQPTAEKPIKKETVPVRKEPKEDSSFFSYLKDNLDAGLKTVSKSIYDAPGMVYDAAAVITNPIMEVLGADKDKLASSDKLAKDLGIRNIPSETLKKRIDEANEKVNSYSQKNGGDALTALENGNYSGAAKMIAGTTMQSLPIMVAAMASGGSAGAMTAIGASTASTKNAQLKEEHPEMAMGTRIKNAATSGVLEATLGHLFTGASGSVIKKILADKGVEAGSRIISNSFRSTIEKSIAKSPLAGAFGEMIEESAVEFGNQLNDIDSGIRKEFDIHAIKNAGLSATGMGGLNTVGIYGAKAYVKNKDYQALKSVNKEIDKLSTELANENISPENKEIIASRIDRLVTENKRILGAELEKLKALPIEVKTELNTINNTLSDIRTKADNIKEDFGIAPEIKEKLLQELNIQSKNAGKRKLEILNSTNGTSVSSENTTFESVEPDFDLANENQSNEPANETTTTETQPQAEVQEQTEEQEVEANSDKQSEIDTEIERIKQIDNIEERKVAEIKLIMSNLFSGVGEASANKIKEYSDRVLNGTETREQVIQGLPKSFVEGIDTLLKVNNYNETASRENIISDGDVRPASSNVGENRITEPKSTSKESVSSSVERGEGEVVVEVDPVDHAKSEIEKGVLTWNGDMGAERVNLGIPWADIRKGQKDILAGKINTAPAKKLIEALNTAKKNGGYEYKQGSGTQSNIQFVTLDDVQRATNEYEFTDSEQKEVADNETELARAYDDYFNGLSEDEQIQILENYENRQDDSAAPSADSGQPKSETNVPESEEKPRDKKPKPKPRTATERIKSADAKVDDFKNALKGIDSIFGIKIKVEDIDGLNSNGVDIIDVIASIAKQAIAAGIHIDDAINKTIEHLKKTVDFEVSIDEIKSRINPIEFESRSEKKSLLSRLINGGNPSVITKSVRELGENYDVRSQKEADAEAIAFIDKVGAAAALKAVQDGLIKNMDVKMLIYDEALTRLKVEISDEISRNPEEQEALITKFKELSNEFDMAIRDAGQGISIMNFIYNKNQTLKYSLSKVIKDYKNNSINGKIPADVEAKFEALNEKLKNIEKKIKEAEERAKKAEDALVIKNINEDLARKKQQAGKNKSGLTESEQVRKKELKNKFFGRFNDVTSMVTILADPEFREYLGLMFKQAKGDFDNFSSAILKELGKGARKHLPELYREAGGRADVSVSQLSEITIGEDSKIKIPAQLLRDYVEAGETDIDVIASKIKEDIADEFPDVDEREIRDALTGYGKQINPNPDEIASKVNKLKEYGRLLSAYDDVVNGLMPLKSGIKRDKVEQRSRELRSRINQLAKELNLESVDLETQWAAALDRIKSNLRNRIEDLNKQIDNKERRRVERTATPLDAIATELKAKRDALKKELDDLVGKPELTYEQRLKIAEESLKKSIDKLQGQIDTNDIAFKEKPSPITSQRIEELKSAKRALLELKKEMRRESGLLEEQRLKAAKTRIRTQIEVLKERLRNKDFSKKEIKPILADNELNTLRAEKEAIYDEYEKQKYIQELHNRSFKEKLLDNFLEATALTRAIKASLDLGLIGIQLRGFTYAQIYRNPIELGRMFAKMFGAIGSQKKTNEAMALLIGHPLHALAKKLDIGITHPDLRNEVREEMASGSLLTFAWNLPMTAANYAGLTSITETKRKSIGDTFIDGAMKQFDIFNRNAQNNRQNKEKFTIAEQWKNVNVFEAVERGLSTYGNQLRFEEFVRGVERLRSEGKDEINHEADYKLLAGYVRTFSGRAKPAGFELNQKALNVFFFSFKNAASVFQQLNPGFYLYQHFASSDAKSGNSFRQGTSVANKMAMATMFKSVASTSATLLFLMAGYNAGKDDEDEEATIETDPRSSDFGKFKIGDLRYDPWGGYVPLITLYARLFTEEIKDSKGSMYKMGEKRFGIQSRGDAAARFLFNKESPGFQMFHHYMTSTEKKEEKTGKMIRVNNFGEKLSEDEAFSMYPIFIGSVKKAVEDDAKGVEAFLTAYSVLGLGNVQKYDSKEKNKPKSKGKKSVPGVPNFNNMNMNPQ